MISFTIAEAPKAISVTANWQDDVLNWQGFTSFLAQPAYTAVWLADDVSWLGHCLLQITADTAELITIQVHADYRGNSFGSMLMHHAKDMLLEKGITKLLLDVRPDNASAISLYSKFGAQKIAERKNYYQNPTADAWVYEIHFTAP